MAEERVLEYIRGGREPLARAIMAAEAKRFSPMEVLVLAWLAEKGPGEYTVTEIAADIGAHVGSVSMVVRVLEKAGLVRVVRPTKPYRVAVNPGRLAEVLRERKRAVDEALRLLAEKYGVEA